MNMDKLEWENALLRILKLSIKNILPPFLLPIEISFTLDFSILLTISSFFSID